MMAHCNHAEKRLVKDKMIESGEGVPLDAAQACRLVIIMPLACVS
jgi:hypothetical protein